MWFVYILKCCDNTYYTGITTDLKRRIRQHNWEIVWWAKYTRIRQPVKMIYSIRCKTRSEASKEEYRIKKLTREQKKELIFKN